MHIASTFIDDTHAEAFAASYVRLNVSAADAHWLEAGLNALCGYGTSVIGCDCEIAVEQFGPDTATASVLAFSFTSERLAKAIANRVGQCLLTCPTLTIADGLPEAKKRAPLGDHLRYFGDGHAFKSHDAKKQDVTWALPVMEGEVLLPATIGIERGIAGGNLILQGKEPSPTLAAARRAVEAVVPLSGVITPFPGGVCRSGSKVGARYSNLIASTNHAYCPSLKELVETKLHPQAKVAYEVIMNGVDENSLRAAMKSALHAAAGEEVLMISAGNYGGKLGKTMIDLRDLL